MEHVDLKKHEEGGDNWTHQGGADNETRVKHMKVIPGGNVNRDNTRRNRTFEMKQETAENSRREHEKTDN